MRVEHGLWTRLPAFEGPSSPFLCPSCGMESAAGESFSDWLPGGRQFLSCYNNTASDLSSQASAVNMRTLNDLLSLIVIQQTVVLLSWRLLTSRIISPHSAT